jgi:hypothetical protein
MESLGILLYTGAGKRRSAIIRPLDLDAETEPENHDSTHQGLVDQVTSLSMRSVTNLKKHLTQAHASKV